MSYVLKERSEAEISKIEEDELRRRELEQIEIENAPDGKVHENLKKFRERKGLKKTEIAALMEITPRTYFSYEAGKNPIPSSALVKLATFTGVDMNEILMGRPARTDYAAIKSAFDDLTDIISFLENEYPTMTARTRLRIAKFHVSTDWHPWPRMHPDTIRESVRIKTRYRFHSEDLPAPPYWENYGDNQDLLEEAEAAWQATVDEDFGPDPDLSSPKST